MHVCAQKIDINVLNSQQIWRFKSIYLDTTKLNSLSIDNYHAAPKQIRVQYQFYTKNNFNFNFNFTYSTSSLRLISYNFLGDNIITSKLKAHFWGLGLNSNIKIYKAKYCTLNSNFGFYGKKTFLSNLTQLKLGYSPSGNRNVAPEIQNFRYSLKGNSSNIKYNFSAGLVLLKPISTRTWLSFSSLYEYTFSNYLAFDWYWDFGSSKFATGKIGLSEFMWGIGIGHDF